MALSNDLKIRIDADFPGERKFKSAEASAKQLEREMNKLEAAQRSMVATEIAAYREGEQRAAAREAAVRSMAQVELQAYREEEQRSSSRETSIRRMAQLEEQAYREDKQRAAGRETDIRSMAQIEAQAYREDEQRTAAQVRAAEQLAAAQQSANQRQGAAMQQVGVATLAVSAATVAGLGLATRAAMDWEGAWAGVTKTVDGSPEQMADLEGELRQLARTLPATHEEIAGVAEAAGQLGVERAGITAFTRTMIDLGETTNLSADSAATGLAQLMNVMGTAPEDVGRLGATLVALGNDGASTEAEILSMAQRISGAAKLVGASESDVLALANAMSSMGIESERGSGVAVRVLQDVYSAVESGGDKLGAFAEVAGTSSADFAAAFEADPIRAVDLFVQGLNRVEAGGGNVVQTLNDLGYVGTADTAVLLQLKGAGDLLTDSLDLGNEAWRENTALQEEASKRYETTEARLAIARNTINDTAIDIGANLLPAVAGGADVVANLAAAFGGLSEGEQKFVTFLGVGGAGVLGFVGAASVAVPKVMELKTVLDDLAGGSSRLGKGLGAAVGVLAGPWGLVLAAATLLIGGFAAKQGEAKREADALAGALEAQTGAITESARAMKVDTLVDQGVYAEAEKLGLALDVVTDAALGNKDAIEQLRGRISELQGQGDALEFSDAMAQGYYKEAIAVSELLGKVEESAGVTTKAQEAARLKSEAMGEDAAATEDAGAAAANAAAENEALMLSLTGGEAAASDLTQTVDALSDALDVLNGGQLSANDAARAWEESIDAVEASLSENGTTLDITTEKGRANSAALDAMAQAGMANAEAILRNTGNIDDFQGALAASRDSLFQTAKRFGLSDEAASAYVESVLAVPDEAATKVMLQGVSEAEAKIAKLKQLMASVPKNMVTSFGVAKPLGAPSKWLSPTGVAQADGSVLNFADGAENHVAQIAPAGAMRVWAEPETGGEAYVPLAQGKRPRSKAIVEDVVDRFGGTVRWLADGGLIGPGSTVSQGLLRTMLSQTTGPVSDDRYRTALVADTAAASQAARAEANLTRIREEGTAALDVMREALEENAEIQRERRDAVVEAATAEIDALKERQGAVAEAAKAGQGGNLDALKERQREELDALKESLRAQLDALKESTDDKGRVGAAEAQQRAELNAAEKRQREELDAAEKAAKGNTSALEAAQEAELEAAQARLTQLKKDHAAADEALKEATEDRIEVAEDEHAARVESAEDSLTSAKDRAKAAADELAASERELAEARERALRLAEQFATALARGAAISTLAGDASPRDLAAATKALADAAQAADDAGRAARGEDRDGALQRRSQALADLAAQTEALATAQEAFGMAPAAVKAGIDQQVARITELGRAYGLTTEQVADLTGRLADRAPTGGDLLGSMRREADRVEEMAGLLRQLSDQGLDAAILDDLAGQGTGGLSTARALAGGGAGLVADLNNTQAELVAVSKDLGAYVAAARYDPSRVQSVSVDGSVAINDASLADLADRVGRIIDARPLVVKLDGKVLANAVNQQNAQARYQGKAP